nr:MetaGeneMark_Unknown Function [uncultured bacterium]
MPSLEDSLERFFQECKWERGLAAASAQTINPIKWGIS